LSVDEVLVDSSHVDELLVVALLDDLTVLENHNLVGILDGTESVGNDDDGLASLVNQLIESSLDLEFRLSVKGRSSFIKENDVRVANESSGNSHSLLLASRETHSSFSYNGVVAFREDGLVHDEVVAVGILACGLKHFQGCLLILASQVDTIEDVISDGVGEKNRLLLHDSHLSLMVPLVVTVL